MRKLLSILLLFLLLAPAAGGSVSVETKATTSDQAGTPIGRGLGAAPGPSMIERMGSGGRDAGPAFSPPPTCLPRGERRQISASPPPPPRPARTASLYLSHCALLC